MLREIKREDIPGEKRREHGYAKKAILEFLDSKMTAALFEPPSGVKSAYVSLVKAMDRLRAPVKVMTRGGKIYLEREEEKA